MKKKKTGIARLFDFAGKYRPLTIVAGVLSGTSAVLALCPFICIWLVMREVFSVFPNVSEASDLASYGWMAVAFAIGSMLIYFAALMCSHIAAFRTARNMRSAALHHIITLPLGFFSGSSSGKLRKIIDECAGQTEGFLAHQLPDFIGAVVTPVVAVVLLFVFDWRLGFLCLVPILISFFILAKMMGGNSAQFMKEYQDAQEEMTVEAVEYVRGIPVVKVFQQTVYSFKSFHGTIMKYMKLASRYSLSWQLPMTGFTVSVNAAFALLVPAGILMIGSVADPKAFLLNFIFYILFTPVCSLMVTRIMYVSESLMQAGDAVARIDGILSESPLAESECLKKPEGSSVSFQNVTFTYPGTNTPALKNVSFELAQGKTVALVGPSGGGKTTAASLIPRFFDVQSGSVSVGGVDVREMATQDLMNQVAFVFQDTHLFKASILDNIRSARPQASREEATSAAKAARCMDILDKLPSGIDTVIGTKGVYLSGGEQQRIALARAMLKDAPIIVLDEATAFADPDNEHQIQLAFTELTKGKTVLMIAHRLSTVKNADVIIVMEDGGISQQGTHGELIEQGGRYAALWRDYQTSVSWKVGKESTYA